MIDQAQAVIFSNIYSYNRKSIENSIEEHLMKIKELRKSLKRWEKLKEKNDEFQKKISDLIPADQAQQTDAIEQLDKM